MAAILQHTWYLPTRTLRALRSALAPYALSGTELAYGATRCPVLTQRMVLRGVGYWTVVCRYAECGTDTAYAATRYAGMALPDVRYYGACGTELGYSGTELGYGGTGRAVLAMSFAILILIAVGELSGITLPYALYHPTPTLYHPTPLLSDPTDT
eukprot:2641165-Rhodomonas_salina.2